MKGEEYMKKEKQKKNIDIEKERQKLKDAKMIEEDTKIWKEFRKYH